MNYLCLSSFSLWNEHIYYGYPCLFHPCELGVLTANDLSLRFLSLQIKSIYTWTGRRY